MKKGLKKFGVGAVVAVGALAAAFGAEASCRCAPEPGKPGVTYSGSFSTFQDARGGCRFGWNTRMREAGYSRNQMDGQCVIRGHGSLAGKKAILEIRDGRELRFTQ